MMAGFRASVLLLVVLAALPLFAHAQECIGAGNGKCEVGEGCECTDCWGINPPTSLDDLNRPETCLCSTTGCEGNSVCLKDPLDPSTHSCQLPPTWYKPEVERVAGSWEVWGPIALLAVFVSFLVVALAYMLGIGFDLQPLRMWAKSEMYQAIANAVIVASLIMLVTLATDRGLALILGQAINPFNMAYGYLLPLIAQLQNLYAVNYATCFPIEVLASYNVYNNAAPHIMTYLMFFLKPLIIEPLHIANYFILQALIMAWFQVALLNFFQKAAFATLLPLGVILRIFPFSRGTGGLLISMAIAFYFVYPIMFGFISMMSEDEIALRAAMGGDTGVGVDAALYNACDQDIEGAVREGEAQTDPAVISKINERYSFLPPIVMKIMFYPLVVFAVTFTFIKMASPLLGADVSEVGQGLVRLI